MISIVYADINRNFNGRFTYNLLNIFVVFMGFILEKNELVR